MSCRHSPEVITISDSDEQESLDLFNSTAEEEGASVVARSESDDLFSSDCEDREDGDQKGIIRKNNTSSISDSVTYNRTNDKISSGRRTEYNNGAQCSSSIRNFVHRNHHITSSPCKNGVSVLI